MADRFRLAQNAILVNLASKPDAFAWPALTPTVWRKLSVDSAYADRVEFVGDSLVHTAIALRLHERYPQATAGLYTIMMQALVSNATFYYLTVARPTAYTIERPCVKTGRLIRHRVVASSTKRPVVKRGGDRFETVVAEYYTMHGLDALLGWTTGLFDELIAVAWEALHENSQPRWTTEQRKRSSPVASEEDARRKRARSRESTDPAPRPNLATRLTSPKARSPPIYISSRSSSPALAAMSQVPDTPLPTVQAQQHPVMGDGSLSNFSFNLATPSTRQPKSSQSHQPPLPTHPGLLGQVPAPRPPPEVIDLTMDSDEDEDQITPPVALVDTHTADPVSEDHSAKTSSDLPPAVFDILVTAAKEKPRDVIPDTVVIDGLCDSEAGDTDMDTSIDGCSIDMDMSFGSSGYILPPGLSPEQLTASSAEQEEEADMAEVEELLDWLEDLGPGVDKVSILDREIATETPAVMGELQPLAGSLKQKWKSSGWTTIRPACGSSLALLETGTASDKPPSAFDDAAVVDEAPVPAHSPQAKPYLLPVEQFSAHPSPAADFRTAPAESTEPSACVSPAGYTQPVPVIASKTLLHIPAPSFRKSKSPAAQPVSALDPQDTNAFLPGTSPPRSRPPSGPVSRPQSLHVTNDTPAPSRLRTAVASVVHRKRAAPGDFRSRHDDPRTPYRRPTFHQSDVRDHHREWQESYHTPDRHRGDSYHNDHYNQNHDNRYASPQYRQSQDMYTPYNRPYDHYSSTPPRYRDSRDWY